MIARRILSRFWIFLTFVMGMGAIASGWIAFNEYQQMGDMRFAWGWNSLIAGGFWFWQFFHTDS